MKHTQVKVVIPVYKPTLSEQEHASLAQTAAVLGSYPLVLLKPCGVDTSAIVAEFPQLKTLEVSDEWLGVKNGIDGYNRMMLSKEFYDLFPDTEYILICHTDAWIFRNELSAWCERGYDCVAAPWIKRGLYEQPLVKHYMLLQRWFADKSGLLTRQVIYNKIGNGGLSLRKVESFRAVCEMQGDAIEHFLSSRHHLFNEDVFWAVIPLSFKYPTVSEALRFAFDTNPVYCYKLSGRKLPFGCHSWSKPRMYRFWHFFIPQ
ncbi:MAG: DUF5672 family protein [Alistipes sp.]